MEKGYRRQERRLEVLKQYKLAHQTLAITGINFETKSIVGYVEITVHPLRADMKRLKVNSKQCRIYRITVNDVSCEVFYYNDPGLDICQSEALRRDIEYFKGCHLAAQENTDPERCNGELTICLPPAVQQTVSELRALRVNIEFSLEEPEGGIQFVVPEMEGSMAERSAHLFSCGRDNSSRLWFPCLDSYSDPCTWKLEFTVDNDMTAVSCGDLIETVYTADMRRKTLHYYQSVPTAAPNIGIAVGPFQILVDGNMNEVTNFCLPFLMPVLKHSTVFLHKVFEFYEELLSTRYPYTCYKQVFVAQAYEDCRPYAGMTIFSTNLLHSARIIDQTPISRKLMAEAIAQQFFGCFISMQSWCDAWLTKGISGYLSYLYVKQAFGNNEYRHSIGQMLNEVQEYERDQHPIVLDPSVAREYTYFPVRSPHTVPTSYAEMMKKKAILVVRMLELRIGLQLLLQVFNKLLAVANNSSQQKFAASTWHNMHVSTHSFLKVISLVTGKDCQYFIDQWVCQSGCARFSGSFVFNRKRNVVELELKQDMNAKGATKYVGPLTVTIQELDGSFNHTFQIEENRTKFEITCHSKSRRNKKKKIPLVTGEEVDMDLSAMDDSPVLWLRIDPDMQILRHVAWEQPDYMWQYQVKYERDVVAQGEAIRAMMSYATPATRLALTDTVESEQCFYRIRMEATICLALVANSMVTNWAGPPAMMTIFRKMFGSHSCSTIVKQNHFTNFQHYFLQKTIPLAMATLRDIHGICPIEVISFLLDLFKYNDNSRCKFSDCYYRASLIDAAAATLTPAVTVPGVGGQPTADCLTPETKLILDEVVRYLNLEKLMPCYRLTVTVSCLRALRKMQKLGHTPRDAMLFRSYAQFGNFLDVRLAGIEALVDFVKEEGNAAELNWLLNIVEDDPEPYIKHRLVQMLTRRPPFTKKDSESRLNTVDLVDRLWKLINSATGHDSRLRCDLVDLYVTLYGRTRPSILPPSKHEPAAPLPSKHEPPSTSYASYGGAVQEFSPPVKRKRGRPPLSSYKQAPRQEPAPAVISASPAAPARSKPQIPHRISVSRSQDEETIDLSRPIKAEMLVPSVPEAVMEEEIEDKPELDYGGFLSRMGQNEKDKMDVSEENIDVEGIRSSDEGVVIRPDPDQIHQPASHEERSSKLSDDSISPPRSPGVKVEGASAESSQAFSTMGDGAKVKFSLGLSRSEKKKKKKNKKHKKHKHKKQEDGSKPPKVAKLSMESFAYPPPEAAKDDSESSSAEFEVI